MTTSHSIYLDYAAATPVAPEVLAVMQPYFAEKFYNPSASYLSAQRVRQDLDAARAVVARCLGARASEVIFTAGGTEANNLGIHGVLQQFPNANIVTSAIEHESVLTPAAHYRHRVAPVDAQGIIDMTALERLIDEQTVLVSVMYANNEVGSIEPIKNISRLIETIRRERQKTGNVLPIYFHTDAAQAGNYLDLQVARLGVDLMTLNGGKLYGPKQSGVLFVKAGIVLQPQILGGGQEWGVRSGTENVPACIGLGRALDIAQAKRHGETRRLQSLQKQFLDQLQQRIPAVVINGSLQHRLPNNVHLTIPGQDNERLLFGLDEAGIQAAAGSACSASDEEPSHVLRAMGITKADTQASLRFTMGQSTTEQDVQRTVATLARLIA